MNTNKGGQGNRTTRGGGSERSTISRRSSKGSLDATSALQPISTSQGLWPVLQLGFDSPQEFAWHFDWSGDVEMNNQVNRRQILTC